MRALPVRPEPLWLIGFHQRITVSLWFVPTMFAAAAIGAANLTIWLDTRIAGTAGVVSATDFHGLVTLCRRKKCWLELTVGAGEYLVHGTPIALVHGAAALDGPEVSKFFLMRGERTFVQGRRARSGGAGLKARRLRRGSFVCLPAERSPCP